MNVQPAIASLVHWYGSKVVVFSWNTRLLIVAQPQSRVSIRANSRCFILDGSPFLKNGRDNSDLGNELEGIFPSHSHSIKIGDHDAHETYNVDPCGGSSGDYNKVVGGVTDLPSGITSGNTLRPPAIAVNFWKRMGGYTMVTFQDYDGSIISQQEVPYPSTVTPPTPPSHPDLTFVGWNSDLHVSSTPLIITAIYTYTITANVVRKYSSSGYTNAPGYGTVTGTGTFYSYDTVHTLTATPNGSRTFVEWRLNNATYSTDPTITISEVGNKALQAVFQ